MEGREEMGGDDLKGGGQGRRGGVRERCMSANRTRDPSPPHFRKERKTSGQAAEFGEGRGKLMVEKGGSELGHLKEVDIGRPWLELEDPDGDVGADPLAPPPPCPRLSQLPPPKHPEEGVIQLLDGVHPDGASFSRTLAPPNRTVRPPLLSSSPSSSFEGGMQGRYNRCPDPETRETAQLYFNY